MSPGGQPDTGASRGPGTDRVAISVSPDYRIFVLFCFLNRYGYDLEGNPEMHPVRLAVRKALAQVPADPGELEFSRLAVPFHPRVGLIEAFALHQSSWPAADPGDGGCFEGGSTGSFEEWLEAVAPELPGGIEPGFVSRLPAMGQILARFEARSGADRLWHRYLPDHLSGREELVQAVNKGLEASRAVLGLTGWPFRSIRVIPNLLQSDWLADQFLIGDTLSAVIASAAPSLAPSVLHEALHMVIRPPVGSPQVSAVLADWEGRSGPVRLKMEPQGYWGPDSRSGLYRAVQEAVVRAVTIAVWYRDPAERRRRIASQVERGFDLAGPMVDYFSCGNRDPLRPAALARMLHGVLLDLLGDEA